MVNSRRERWRLPSNHTSKQGSQAVFVLLDQPDYFVSSPIPAHPPAWVDAFSKQASVSVYLGIEFRYR